MKQNATWLIANWKMNGTAQAVAEYARGLEEALMGAAESLVTVFCPPVPYIALASQILSTESRIKLGGQDCHAEAKGAFTGDVSAAMLADVGAGYVILGHSERRAAGETDAAILAKANAAIAAGLVPVLCVGESHTAYTEKQTMQVLDQQMLAFKTLPVGAYLIAYEPIWAIGTGLTPSTLEIEAAHSHIKSVLGSETSVLYGGSVNAGNAKEILRLSHVSGALVGGASLQLASMKDIIAASAANGE